MTPVLDVLLNDYLVGSITLLPGERSLFAFDDAYVADKNRPVLSQSFLTASGDLSLETRAIREKLPPWFSNLLPEGPLRDYLAERGGVGPHREFYLLALLGQDLPGAVRVRMHGETPSPETVPPKKRTKTADGALHFSLAGVQLKFSALMNRKGGLTIPASGVGGDWIIKLPSATYPAVPENETAMLRLAEAVGIAVPEHRLVPIDKIEGLPPLGPFAGKQALAVRRFDRLADGTRVHMEDLAQVFGVVPEEKYKKVGTAQIVGTIAQVLGQAAAQDFIARLVFVILTGNGDMHLKNWSLLYPDGRTPQLTPAYDLVSTVPYIPHDGLALNLVGEKNMHKITRDRLKRLAEKAALPERETLATADRIVEAVREAWPNLRGDFDLPAEILQRIEAHMQSLPLWQEV